MGFQTSLLWWGRHLIVVMGSVSILLICLSSVVESRFCNCLLRVLIWRRCKRQSQTSVTTSRCTVWVLKRGQRAVRLGAWLFSVFFSVQRADFFGWQGRCFGAFLRVFNHASKIFEWLRRALFLLNFRTWDFCVCILVSRKLRNFRRGGLWKIVVGIGMLLHSWELIMRVVTGGRRVRMIRNLLYSLCRLTTYVML